MSRAARICWGLTIVYWCGLFVLTHLPAVPPPIVPVKDKTAHFVGYALLAGGLFTSIWLAGDRDHRRAPARVALTVLLIALAYGAIDEWLQIPVGRSCELLDWVADAAGAATTLVIAVVLARLLGKPVP